MHGLGNDFVIIDSRKNDLRLLPSIIRAISDRHLGVGCDQLILLTSARDSSAHIYMEIYNADGTTSNACGNATRCVGALMMNKSGLDEIKIQTGAGILRVIDRGNKRVTVDMGLVRVNWKDIPLSKKCDTRCLPIKILDLENPLAVSIGNPHMVFFVSDIDLIPLQEIGGQLECHPLFPERTNVQIVQVIGEDKLRLRTWERGTGLTMASGSGACASLVAAYRKGLTGRVADVSMDGGDLHIEFKENNYVFQTGPIATSFSGILDPSFFDEMDVDT